MNSPDKLLIQSQLYKLKKKVWKMFKVNNKNTRTTSLMSWWCFYCLLWRHFTPFSIAFVDFEQVNLSWVIRIRFFDRFIWGITLANACIFLFAFWHIFSMWKSNIGWLLEYIPKSFSRYECFTVSPLISIVRSWSSQEVGVCQH